ncbi:hypothetical protein GOHSU_41_00320 [Gordonia hirsuta DSM 44140 = NBRC 16056]|uniref:Uncharacterized protein n=1 Tax=Gordonia hirsuta DSM 44140 = NBRC 16056 TaxID=1121927 RepID=L7LC76_9ACTN|nr:hypothetical protein GOHSU_41_00320 [Gordonia hirsuta DSM 44140 = NBRC 16056]
MIAWLSLASSFVAIAISILAYRAGQPRLKLSASSGLLIPIARGTVQVVVENTGGAPAVVSQVSIRSIDNHVFGKPFNGIENPQCPLTLAAHGGRAVWNFDARQLSLDAEGAVREKPLVVRAEAAVGSKTYRSRKLVVNLPGDLKVRLSRRTRLRRSFQSWVNPRITVVGGVFHEIPAPDCATVDYLIRTSGKGVTRKQKLTLVVEHSDGRRARVPNVAQVELPRLWFGKKEDVVTLPVVEEPAAPDDQYWWIVTNANGVGEGHGISATTRSDIQEVRQRFQERGQSGRSGADSAE